MELNLRSLSCGLAHLRYTFFDKTGANEWTLFHSTHIHDTETSKKPLFLGTDVVALTNQTKNHWSRIHQKWCSLGLATNISFHGVKVAGINNCTNMWFYSIQGLFRLVFEQCGMEVQKAVVSALKAEWMKHCVSDPLPARIDHVTLTGPPVSSNPDSRYDEVLDRLISIIESLELSPAQGSHTVLQSVHDLLSAYKRIRNKFNMDTVSQLIDFHVGISDHVYACAALSNQGHEHADQEAIVEATCSYIGKKFGQMATKVQQSVLDFKKNHIDCIHNLPKAEELCQQVFPKCMQALFTSWLTASHNNRSPSDSELIPSTSRGEDQGVGESTDASSMAKRPRIDLNIYPFIQLILEFSNNALISGVAHVLYARLLLDLG